MHLLAHNLKTPSETVRVYPFPRFNFHDPDPIASGKMAKIIFSFKIKGIGVLKR